MLLKRWGVNKKSWGVNKIPLKKIIKSSTQKMNFSFMCNFHNIYGPTIIYISSPEISKILDVNKVAKLVLQREGLLTLNLGNFTDKIDIFNENNIIFAFTHDGKALVSNFYVPCQDLGRNIPRNLTIIKPGFIFPSTYPTNALKQLLTAHLSYKMTCVQDYYNISDVLTFLCYFHKNIKIVNKLPVDENSIYVCITENAINMCSNEISSFVDDFINMVI